MDFAMLVVELEKKLGFRGRSRDGMSEALGTKEARYRKLWAIRLERQMVTLPRFDEVFRSVRRSLREAGLVES